MSTVTQAMIFNESSKMYRVVRAIAENMSPGSGDVIDSAGYNTIATLETHHKGVFDRLNSLMRRCTAAGHPRLSYWIGDISDQEITLYRNVEHTTPVTANWDVIVDNLIGVYNRSQINKLNEHTAHVIIGASHSCWCGDVNSAGWFPYLEANSDLRQAYSWVTVACMVESTGGAEEIRSIADMRPMALMDTGGILTQGYALVISTADLPTVLMLANSACAELAKDVATQANLELIGDCNPYFNITFDYPTVSCPVDGKIKAKGDYVTHWHHGEEKTGIDWSFYVTK